MYYAALQFTINSQPNVLSATDKNLDESTKVLFKNELELKRIISDMKFNTCTGVVDSILRNSTCTFVAQQASTIAPTPDIEIKRILNWWPCNKDHP
jgi:hypothetical protein